MNEIHVGVRELRAHFREYLRQVRQGKTVIITQRGQPVGRITPIEQSLEGRVRALQSAGLVAWNGKKLKPLTPAAVNRGKIQVSDLLVEMRV